METRFTHTTRRRRTTEKMMGTRRRRRRSMYIHKKFMLYIIDKPWGYPPHVMRQYVSLMSLYRSTRRLD
jgi:hypothetical protein